MIKKLKKSRQCDTSQIAEEYSHNSHHEIGNGVVRSEVVRSGRCADLNLDYDELVSPRWLTHGSPKLLLSLYVNV
jgi:hypothetical protein